MYIRSLNYRITVRQTKDIEVIKELHREILPGDEFYERDTNRYWLAFCDGVLAGFCIATVLQDRIVFLSRSGVLPEFRGLGIQKRMIQIRLWFARKIKSPAAITYTMKDNHASSNNLVKCDFRLYDPEYPYAGPNVLYWIKMIKKEEGV